MKCIICIKIKASDIRGPGYKRWRMKARRNSPKLPNPTVFQKAVAPDQSPHRSITVITENSRTVFCTSLSLPWITGQLSRNVSWNAQQRNSSIFTHPSDELQKEHNRNVEVYVWVGPNWTLISGENKMVSDFPSELYRCYFSLPNHKDLIFCNNSSGTGCNII